MLKSLTDAQSRGVHVYDPKRLKTAWADLRRRGERFGEVKQL